MDSINPLISGHHPANSPFNKKEKSEKAAKKGKSSFQKVFSRQTDSPAAEIGDVQKTPEELEAWVNDIFKLGEEVKKDATLDALSEYRASVSRFLKYVLSKGYQLERRKGILNPRTLKQKEFVNVEVVNKKLDSLAAYVLSTQKNQLDILKKVDEINGLIVDCLG